MEVLEGLWSETEACQNHALVRLRGVLTLVTVPRVRRVLDKLLRDPGAVVVDLSELELGWKPALEVFPSALAAAGGWSTARLVLTGADEPLAAQLRGLRVHRTVPLVDDPAAAPARLEQRPDHVARHRDLPLSPYAPAMARDLVRDTCADWSIMAAEDAAALVASELVSNAVQHARSGCRLSMHIDSSGLHIAVRDYAPGRDLRPRPVDAARAEGRGMHLVATLSSAWGVREQADGKTAWAVLALPA
ncbi:histidine kinase-like protein [Pseudonocardia hierapolitana]|uniref:Histidine kinase-like protein n=1 Tax=Pseudonocardia hierapolitana TaxID=1128676 RepID=A0A561SJZ0_9PSEU|nr:ATP-binding protein [Pseudonocardia hierapolitana]TWF75175.1 histidine kinase-like protein [Pseudonocardia hierapolitana]